MACRETADKRALARVVRTPDGRVAIDRTGKANGRGAYVHESLDCWQAALKKDRLTHALKVTIAPDDRATLERHADALAVTQEQQN